MTDGTLWILTGPTASGKSGLALELAQRRDCEIVCMDSMQIYRGMDIGTAKPTAEEQRLVPHHMLDVCDPREAYSVVQWVEDALREAVNPDMRVISLVEAMGDDIKMEEIVQSWIS